MADEDRDEQRKLDIRERLIEMDIERFFAITLDLFKWITAATLSINGAPLLAMLGSESLRQYLFGPGIAFAIGLSFSIFGNLILVKALANSGEQLFNAHWSGGEIEKQSYKDVVPEIDANRSTIVAAILLGLSTGAFLTGIIWLGLSLEVK